jgi:exonuclease III
LSLIISGDLLDEQTALVEGYNSYFSYSRGKAGYSGVAIYCKDCATPVKAEEGLTGLLTPDIDDSIGCYGDQTVFSEDELQALDNEGRCVITQHKIRFVLQDCTSMVYNEGKNVSSKQIIWDNIIGSFSVNPVITIRNRR